MPTLAEIEAKLIDLSKLKPDWDSYGALEVDDDVICAAMGFVLDLPENLICHLTAVMATSGGGITIEATHGKRELEFEFISPTTITYWAHCEGRETDETDDISPRKHIKKAIELLQWVSEDQP